MKSVKRIVTISLIISIIASMLTGVASASNDLAFGAATVNTSALRLRSGPGLNHDVISLLSEGDIVVILERENSEWYRVNFHGNIGYVSVPLLRDILTAENFNALGRIIGTSGSNVNLRARPNTTSNVLTRAQVGTVMTVIGINNGWYKVQHNGHTAYVRSDLMDIIPGQRPASVPSPTPPAPIPVSSAVAVTSPAPTPNLELGNQLVEYALSYIGHPYVFGGASPSTGFDCSGFVSYIFRTHNMSLTRNASGQFRDNGVHISRNDLMPGDLVFFSSNGRGTVTHVGIYIGGEEFVHASGSAVGVVISRLDSTYYRSVWHGAKRVLL